MGDTPVTTPHAPEIGRFASILGRFHVTGAFWYRFHAFGVRVAPRRVVGFFVASFTALFFCVLFRIRRAIAANLDAVLGPCGAVERQRRIWRTMWCFAWCLTERYERLCADRPVATTADNLAAWERATGDGSGAVLITGHVGNWEIGSAIPATVEQRRIHLVREEERDPAAQAFVRELLERRMGDHYTTHFATDDITLGVALVEALGRGELVALQTDRPRAGGRVVSVRLFGRPFELPVGPIVVARTAGVPLLPVFVIRIGRLRYRICFRSPIAVDRSADRGRDVERAADEIARALEWAIGEAPHQWFCFRSLWAGSAASDERAQAPAEPLDPLR